MICEKKQCLGCFACYNICQKNSISMEYDEIGHIYPVIDENICNKCGICYKVCPANKFVELKAPIKAYASWSNNKKERITSTSGGVASCMSNGVIVNNGVVYGAAYDNDFNVNHIRVDKIEDLIKLKGSKYVHSWINDIFRYVKKDLETKKEVLFIGTPCQVAGLKSFLHKEYDNLITIDIVCHGVPSHKLFKEHIYNIVKDKRECKISFRNEYGYFLEIKKDGNLIYSSSMMEDSYYKGFIRSLYNRYSCNNCKFSGKDRIADLTLGDFWGLGDIVPFNYDKKDGVSLILVNSPKGEQFLSKFKQKLFLEERDLKEAFQKNAPLNNNILVHKKYDYFRRKYLIYGFEKTVRKCFKNEERLFKLKNMIKKLLIK